MKTKINKSCLLLVLLFIFSIAWIPLVAKEDLDVIGDLDDTPRSRSVVMPKIKGYITQGENIEVIFCFDLNTVDVKIENEIGAIVYEESVNTAMHKNLSIDISKLAIGAYKVSFIESDGCSSSANFVVY